jgi:hypothetical protein
MAVSDVQHWIDVFTLETWEEFLAADASTSGFPKRRWTTVQQMDLGDRLYGYVAGISRWIAVLEVTGPAFQDTTPIWKADYPARIPVRVVEQLTPETAVPALSLRDRMSLFAGLTNPNKWSIYFRSSPGHLSAEDGAIVEEAIRDAKLHPVYRPVKPTKPVEGPPAIPTADEVLVTIPEDDEGPDGDVPEPTATAHTEIQWLLLKLGSDMGLDVWVASNDRKRQWQGQVLGSMPHVQPNLPTQFDAVTQGTIERIDVLWLDGNSIVAAFEVEHTTSVYSGLLRMSDLLAMQPNLKIPLFVVAPDERRDKVVREVNRPTFSRLTTPLADVCRFIAFEALRQHVTDAKQYARYLKPDVLQEISESCELSQSE